MDVLEIVTHLAAAGLGSAASAIVILPKWRPMGAIEATRVLTVYFVRSLPAIKNMQDTGAVADLTAPDTLVADINAWMKYPNALGSEAQAARLVGMIQALTNPSKSEIAEIDRALQALNQRAAERERSRDHQSPSAGAVGHMRPDDRGVGVPSKQPARPV